MAQVDDIVGNVMKKLKEMGVDENAIVVFTTDNVLSGESIAADWNEFRHCADVGRRRY